MRRTLLLCFVHGFKGDDDTFGVRSQFSQDLRARVAQALPKVDVRTAVYPTYETRGDLAACVARFIEWWVLPDSPYTHVPRQPSLTSSLPPPPRLLEKVIDMEVAARTPSPTVDPSVHCVLIGHSMGGIVAADALLALAGDRRVGEDEEAVAEARLAAAGGERPSPELNSLMFPYVRGVLGCDTPYLGIAPGVVAHGAEGQYAAASAAVAQISGLTEALWGKTGAGGGGGSSAATRQAALLPAGSGSATAGRRTEPASSSTSSSSSAAATWGWGKIALYAGAGAIASTAAAAAAAVAYQRRDQLSEGWTWATSHLEFVNCLARGEVLRARVARVVEVRRQLGVGFGNLYTRLGRRASRSTGSGSAAKPAGVALLLPAQRTFCNLPSGQTPAGDWRPAVNDAAADETSAHMGMFDPAYNPNYATLLADAGSMVVAWTAGSAWYEGSGSGSGLAERRLS